MPLLDHYLLSPLLFIIIITLSGVISALLTLAAFTLVNRSRRRESFEILAHLGIWKTLLRLWKTPDQHTGGYKTSEIRHNQAGSGPR